MKIKTPEKRPSTAVSLSPEQRSPKRAKLPKKPFLWRLSDDVLQTELIPRLQAHRDGSVLAFAQTSSAARAQTTFAVAKQLLGQVRTAINVNAFASDVVDSAQGTAAVFEPGVAHPAATAYAALLRLESFFAARGISAQVDATPVHRSSGSVADALSTVEMAMFSCLRPNPTMQQQPTPHNTVAALQDIRAHMLQPIDAWVAASKARAVAEPSYDLAALRTCLGLIDQTAERIKNRASDSIDFDLQAFRAAVVEMPPIWLYDDSMNQLQLVLAPGTVVPEVLSHLPAIQTLKVMGSIDVAQLEALVRCFQNVETLVLGGLTMQSLPASLTALHQLKQLSFHGPSLTDINCLSGMPQLKYLVADDCPHLNFPIGVCSLTNLEILGFYHCGVSAVPSEISQLQKLRMVEIYSDVAVDLPEAFKDLANLRVLELNSSATRLPLFAAEMTNLKILNWGRDSDHLNTAPDRLGHLVKGEEGYRSPEVTQDDVDDINAEMFNWYVTI